MRSPNLRLTVTREGFSITPLPAQVESRCTFDHSCSQRASHRLLIAQPTTGVALFATSRDRVGAGRGTADHHAAWVSPPRNFL